MPETLYHCSEGGLLVSGDDWLPTDPRDYHFNELGARFGCNRLRCVSCGEPVRAVLGFLREPVTPPAALEALGDWTTLAEYREGAPGRLYACRCAKRFIAVGTFPIELPEDEFHTPPPWHCAGHPALATPTEFAGVALAATPDWRAVAAAALDARAPAPHPRLAGCASLTAHRLYRALGSTGERDALSTAIAELAAEAAAPPDRLAAATLFFAANAPAAGIETFARAARAHLDRFRGVAAWGPEPTLDRYLFGALARAVRMTGGQSPEALATLRHAATTAPGVGPFVYDVAGLDGAWARANFPTLVSAAPDDWQRVFANVRPEDAALITQAGQALAGAGRARRDEVVAAARTHVGAAVADEVAARWP